VWDLNNTPLPFKANKFDEILCDNLLEHEIALMPLMGELHRILKAKGRLIIISPHFNSRYAYGTLTHAHFFSSTTFDTFIDKDVPSYDLKKNYSFSSIKKRITFRKRWFYFWNYLLEPLINISEATRIFYEDTPLRIFPSLNIRIELIK